LCCSMKLLMVDGSLVAARILRNKKYVIERQFDWSKRLNRNPSRNMRFHFTALQPVRKGILMHRRLSHPLTDLHTPVPTHQTSRCSCRCWTRCWLKTTLLQPQFTMKTSLVLVSLLVGAQSFGKQ
jgi:hypothetical protein